MRILVFIPRGSAAQLWLPAKLTKIKFLRSNIEIDRTIFIWRENQTLYGQVEGAHLPLPLYHLLNDLRLHDDTPTMLLFAGHGTMDADTDKTISSNNTQTPGVYLIDDVIWISAILYGSNERKGLNPDLNKICLFNCCSGIGYNINTNRVMYVAEQIKHHNINARIKGSKGIVNLCSYFQMYNSGCISVEEIFASSPINLYIRAINTHHPDQITEKALFIGIVENGTVNYEEKNVIDTRPGLVASPLSERISESHPIQMHNPYVITVKKAEFLMCKALFAYRGWGDDTLHKDFSGQPLVCGSDILQKRCVPVNNFLTLYFQYLHNLMTPNRKFALDSMILLQELARVVPTTFPSLTGLHNKLISIFYCAAQEYRSLIRNTFCTDQKFINQLDRLDAQTNLGQVLLQVPERSYYTIWNWTFHLLNTDRTFSQMNENSPGSISVEAFQGNTETMRNHKTVTVFVERHISAQQAANTVMIEIPFTMQSQAEIKTYIMENLHTLGV